MLDEVDVVNACLEIFKNCIRASVFLALSPKTHFIPGVAVNGRGARVCSGGYVETPWGFGRCGGALRIFKRHTILSVSGLHVVNLPPAKSQRPVPVSHFNGTLEFDNTLSPDGRNIPWASWR